jgi:VanZ family protein
MSQPAPAAQPNRKQPVSSVRHRPGKRRFTTVLLRWIVPALLTALILIFGTSIFSLVRTSTILDPVIERIRPGLGPEAIYRLQVLVRHSAHLLEYGALFLVLSVGPLRGRPVVAFFTCIAVASLDESLQLLWPSRSALLSDVAEDATGAAVVLLLALPYWEHLRHLRQCWSKT